MIPGDKGDAGGYVDLLDGLVPVGGAVGVGTG